jgi:hypothetical protein
MLHHLSQFIKYNFSLSRVVSFLWNKFAIRNGKWIVRVRGIWFAQSNYITQAERERDHFTLGCGRREFHAFILPRNEATNQQSFKFRFIAETESQTCILFKYHMSMHDWSRIQCSKLIGKKCISYAFVIMQLYLLSPAVALHLNSRYRGEFT